MRYLFLILILFMTTFTTLAAEEKPRPAGTLACPESLAEIQAMIDTERFTEALGALLQTDPGSLIEVAWIRYLRALAMFGKEEYEAGLDELNAVLIHTDAIDKSEHHRDAFRVAGYCLKKLGWHSRKQKEYDAALEYHSRRFDLAERFGSYQELHDACISIDIDAYFLKDFLLSEEMLTKSVGYAEQIEAEQDRNRSLGISWNNLGGTLTSLKKFEEAEAAARKSGIYWIAFEKSLGHTKEHREIWTYFGIGEIFRNWAESLRESKPRQAKAKRELALAEYDRALKLGEAQALSAEDAKFIQDQVKALNWE
jgi:tetratricopeptide (TPR) repeat protein